MTLFLFFLLYVAPALFLSGHAVAACFSKRVSEYTTIRTRQEALAVFFTGLVPIFNLWVCWVATHEVYIQPWLRKLGQTRLHK